MFKALSDKKNIYTISIANPKTDIPQHTERNFYFKCPLRPGITKDTFRFDILIKMAMLIRKKKIKYLYFESQHIWNAFLMLLCPQCKKIISVHDVIPHDGNKFMDISNFVTSKLANYIILRNYMYKDLLIKKYNLSEKKVGVFELWKDFNKKQPEAYSKRFLFFGRIRKYKGLNLLEKIIENTPDIAYDIVGMPDKESLKIVDKIKTYSNANVVDTEVSDEDMCKYFKNADWVILPYFSATQSGVILDAYRFSRPVIAFNVGAISEQIIDGKTGFLVENNDVNKFIDIINRVNTFSRAELKTYSENAYEYGYKKYAAQNVAKKFLEVILAV